MEQLVPESSDGHMMGQIEAAHLPLIVGELIVASPEGVVSSAMLHLVVENAG